MSFAETSIYYDSVPVFESEDAVLYGKTVTQLALTDAWISPNTLYGKHWKKSASMLSLIHI